MIAHDLVLGSLLERVPLLLELCLDFLHRYEGCRCLALWMHRSLLRAPIANTVRQCAYAAMYQLLDLHGHKDLVFVHFTAGGGASETEFEASFLLNWIDRVSELESTLVTTVLEGWTLL